MNSNNNFFSNSKPELVDDNILDDIIKTHSDSPNHISNKELQKNYLDNMPVKNFYKNKIRPNLIPLIITCVFVLFLIYRFIKNDNKKYKHKHKRKYLYKNNSFTDNNINNSVDNNINNSIDNSIDNSLEDLYDEYKQLLINEQYNNKNNNKNNYNNNIDINDIYPDESEYTINDGNADNQQEIQDIQDIQDNMIDPLRQEERRNQNIMDSVANQLFS